MLAAALHSHKQQQQHSRRHVYCQWTPHEAGFARAGGWTAGVPGFLCAGSERGAAAPSRRWPRTFVAVWGRFWAWHGSVGKRGNEGQAQHFTTRLTQPKRVWRGGVLEACAGREMPAAAALGALRSVCSATLPLSCSTHWKRRRWRSTQRAREGGGRAEWRAGRVGGKRESVLLELARLIQYIQLELVSD